MISVGAETRRDKYNLVQVPGEVGRNSAKEAPDGIICRTCVSRNIYLDIVNQKAFR
jgi:hypothetical protein